MLPQCHCIRPGCQDRRRRVARLIHDVNASDQAAGDQFLRARQAAGITARSQHAAEQAAAEAEKGEVAYQVMQAGQPHRRAPLPRQVLIALVTVILDGLACYLTALALGGSLDATLAWTGLFLGVLAGGQAALGFCRDRGDRARRLPERTRRARPQRARSVDQLPVSRQISTHRRGHPPFSYPRLAS